MAEATAYLRQAVTNPLLHFEALKFKPECVVVCLISRSNFKIDFIDRTPSDVITRAFK